MAVELSAKASPFSRLKSEILTEFSPYLAHKSKTDKNRCIVKLAWRRVASLQQRNFLPVRATQLTLKPYQINHARMDNPLNLLEARMKWRYTSRLNARTNDFCR